jgi:hypothetical protein
MRSKDGPARPSRFEVILPIPPCINEFVSTTALDRLLNLPNSIFTDVTDAINNALGKETVDRGSNATISRYLSKCHRALRHYLRLRARNFEQLETTRHP